MRTLTIIVLGLATFWLSCRPRNSEELIRVLFAGFEYAGVEGALVDPPLRPTGATQFPASVEPGQKYVFYLPQSAAHAGAWTSIRERLRMIGAEILSGPEAARDLLNVTVGGPVFEFRFRYGSWVGTVGSQLEPRVRTNERLAKVWQLESYFLRIDGMSN